MSEARLDVTALIAVASGERVPRPEVVRVLAALSTAIEHASYEDSDQVTWLGDDGAVDAAIVPRRWAEVIMSMSPDPGGIIAELEGLRCQARGRGGLTPATGRGILGVRGSIEGIRR